MFRASILKQCEDQSHVDIYLQLQLTWFSLIFYLFSYINSFSKNNYFPPLKIYKTNKPLHVLPLVPKEELKKCFAY